MKCNIVTTKRSDALFIKKLLSENLRCSECVRALFGETESDAHSRAVSIMVSRHQEPVVLIRDAHTVEPDQISQRLGSLASSMNQFCDPAAYRLLMPAPALDVIFFAEKSLLRRRVGNKLTNEKFICGQYIPGPILKELLGDDYPLKFIESLTDADIETLRQTEFVRELDTAVHELLALSDARDRAEEEALRREDEEIQRALAEAQSRKAQRQAA